MIIKPNQNMKLIKELLEFDSSAQYAFLLIFEQFKGKLLGKINRSKLSLAEKQKLKRGISILKEKKFLIKSTVQSCYMLNPSKFILNCEKFYSKESEIESFWCNIWSYILYKKSMIDIHAAAFTNDYLADIKALWSDIPDKAIYRFQDSWKLEYFRKDMYPYWIENFPEKHESQIINCANMIKIGRKDIEESYEQKIQNNEEMMKFINKTLGGKFTKKDFEKVYKPHSLHLDNLISHKLGVEIAYKYLCLHYQEWII